MATLGGLELMVGTQGLETDSVHEFHEVSRN